MATDAAPLVRFLGIVAVIISVGSLNYIVRPVPPGEIRLYVELSLVARIFRYSLVARVLN